MTCDDLSTAHQNLIDILKPLAGHHIALIAPAGEVRDDRIDQVLTMFEAAGLVAHPGSHIRSRHRYLAGTSDQRLSDLQAAFERPNVSAVWCLRGGYGCAHLLNRIDWSRIPTRIPLIGYSDVSALLEAFQKHGRPGIHGPTATDLAMPGKTQQQQSERADSLQALVRQLQDPERRGRWPLQPATAHPDAPVSGQLLGGNLTVLASLSGTETPMRLTGDTILLLEDVGEAEFRLERSFHQLLDSIDTQYLKAVCLGQFHDCTLASGLDSLGEILAEWLTPLGIPLYTGLPMGHGHANQPWRYGALYQIADNQLSCVDQP